MCDVKSFRVHNDVFVSFYGKWVCEKCFDRHCGSPFLKKEFKIKDDVKVVKVKEKDINIKSNMINVDWKDVLKVQHA